MCHQTHEVEGLHLSLQPPCQTRPGLEAAKPAVGAGGDLRIPLSAQQVMPVFRVCTEQDLIDAVKSIVEFTDMPKNTVMHGERIRR